MISFSTLLITVGLGTIIYLYFKKRAEKKLNFPPGPTPLPLLGNLLTIFSKGFHLVICEWIPKYGDIMSIHLGPKRVVVISDPKLARECFNDLNFTGKPDSESITIVQGGPNGLINSSGKSWEEQRRFSLRHLRDFGFGKNYLEPIIMEEVNELLDGFKELEGRPVDTDRKFHLAVLNSLWHILASKRYKHDDPTLNHILQKSTSVNELFTSSPWFLFPTMCKIVPKLSGWSKLLGLAAEIRQFIGNVVQEHKETFSEDGEPRDFMDSYINEMRHTSDSTSSFYGENGEKHLLATVTDLFGAGSETTSNTLNYSLLLLSKFPEYQKRVQEELDEVVGRNRKPTLSDRPNLPNCLATIEEVLRFNSFVPFGGFRFPHTDTKFQGYDFPKGTWVVANLYWSHYNPKNFENPTKFNPTRFLSANGKEFKKNDNMIAFSIGKRSCLGEVLARDELFLFFTSIFQKFEMTLADESKDVNIIPKPGPILLTPKFKVVMKDRITN